MNLSSFSSDAKQYSLPLYSAATSGLPGRRLSYLWKKPRFSVISDKQCMLTTVFRGQGFKSQDSRLSHFHSPFHVYYISNLVLGISTLHTLTAEYTSSSHPHKTQDRNPESQTALETWPSHQHETASWAAALGEGGVWEH